MDDSLNQWWAGRLASSSSFWFDHLSPHTEEIRKLKRQRPFQYRAEEHRNCIRFLEISCTEKLRRVLWSYVTQLSGADRIAGNRLLERDNLLVVAGVLAAWINADPFTLGWVTSISRPGSDTLITGADAWSTMHLLTRFGTGVVNARDEDHLRRRLDPGQSRAASQHRDGGRHLAQASLRPAAETCPATDATPGLADAVLPAAGYAAGADNCQSAVCRSDGQVGGEADRNRLGQGGG
jgi:hypothetical protein